MSVVHVIIILEKKCTMGTNKNAIKLSNKFVAQSRIKEKRVSPSNVWSIK